MKTKLLVAIMLFATAVSTSHAVVYHLQGTMDVQQAGSNGGFGGGVGAGAGTIAGTYDDVSKLLKYSLTWSNLSSAITNAHFHLGAPGTSGGVELGIPAPWTSPYSNSANLNPTQEANLLAGNWYVNIHTQNHPGGEIRGQVNVPDNGPTFALLGLALITLASLRRKLKG